MYVKNITLAKTGGEAVDELASIGQLPASHGCQADERIVSSTGGAFQRHEAGAFGCAFVALFERERTDEARDAVFVREDPYGTPRTRRCRSSGPQRGR
jgi:hypothetical protein